MADGPYDWEADDARRREISGQHWYRQADNTPLMAGQFWALWDRHMADFKELSDRVEQNEHRLIEERGRMLVHDVWDAFWGKAFVVAAGVLSAFVLTNYLGTRGWPW